MVTIDSDEPRSIKAVEIAGSACQWLKLRSVDGRKAYGIPSQRHAGVYHLTDCQTCTCYDYRRRQQPCKHVLAVRLHCALVSAHPPRSVRRKAV